MKHSLFFHKVLYSTCSEKKRVKSESPSVYRSNSSTGREDLKSLGSFLSIENYRHTSTNSGVWRKSEHRVIDWCTTEAQTTFKAGAHSWVSHLRARWWCKATAGTQQRGEINIVLHHSASWTGPSANPYSWGGITMPVGQPMPEVAYSCDKNSTDSSLHNQQAFSDLLGAHHSSLWGTWGWMSPEDLQKFYM